MKKKIFLFLAVVALGVGIAFAIFWGAFIKHTRCDHSYSNDKCIHCGISTEAFFDFTYVTEYDGYEISAKENRRFAKSVLVIPDSYRGKPVTTIGKMRFNDYSDFGTPYSSVVIPDGVIHIKRNAFFSEDISEINIPASVRIIESGAIDCPRTLERINVDENNPVYHSSGNCLIETETGNLILGCMNSVVPDYVKVIKTNAFYEIASLTELNLPEGLVTIEENAICRCFGLTEIIFPSTMTELATGGVSACSGIEKLEVREGNSIYISDQNCIIETSTQTLVMGCMNSTVPIYVKAVGNYAFYGCSRLTKAEIPEGATWIGTFAFMGCSGLSSVSLPDSLRDIGDWAFSGCSSLESINIPIYVTRIRTYVFYGCISLAEITIHSGIKYIGYDAFKKCTGLERVIFESTEGWRRYDHMKTMASHDGTPIPSSDLSDPERAAKALTETYVKYDLKKI